MGTDRSHRQSFDVLLFDLGGVLVDFTGFEQLSRILGGMPAATAIRNRWIESDAVSHFERGEISSGDFAKLFVAEWQLSLSPDDFLHQFSEWSRGLYPGADRLLRHLQQTHRLACLSNCNQVHASSQRQWLDGLVEHFFFSHEMGAVKPDPAAFDQAIRRLAVPPRRIAYFDDTEVNVEAAAAAGMSAYQVTGLSELTGALQQLGVIAT